MKTTLTEENYLKALFHLVDNEGKVTINELSKFLNVKMPSVNNMMKKFAEKKWVIYETYKPLIVTENGRREAALVVRKHRLTEMFLVKKMNFGWENVHEIAEQLEHVHSQIFFDKMDEILDYPKFDPHGEPIPDKDGNIIAQDLQKLSNCEAGETVIFASVTLSDDAFLSYLNDRKLLLNTKVKVVKIENFDKSMTIEISGKKEILSKKATEKILVKK
ncbi:metal-dependent transcriptional regulator [Chryseobacterium gallinarum]|uniref:Transcriptional regulator MntR n=1 Tax=Chryseobacterium gallinarum TaxID=1324352 RepID=A0A0G3M524_CHRGL|nr:metal-dependent transcriptional regulator [Chryseobacterium gallinarum]AKK74271.1 iron (metal) dependent repressor, dtxr family protein [Chryseobacterium gallinarum]MCL8538126.1 metal-dependent transcriptional regulator [Chryseobacterium gallinarum]QIY89896.1 metal-dependent transcriptional regulator [Chryseobacterium gallinarum]